MRKLQYIVVLIALLSALASAQNCEQYFGGCTTEGCLNNVCGVCKNGNDPASSCFCKTGEFSASGKGGDCAPCDASCKNCGGPGPEACTECDKTKVGLGLNTVQKKCECTPGYKPSGNPSEPCQRCYTYGKECELKCPSGMKANPKYYQCEKDTNQDVENDDDTLYIIVTICLIVLIIVLTVLLYNYFYGVFKKIFSADKEKVLPLTEEEKFFLANQQELERQRRLREEELARQLALEEQQRREEEERRRREREEEERRLREEEERRRREQEEAERRRLEEEEMRRRAEEEARRQMEEEAERRRLEEEERLRKLAEEAERKRLEDEAERERKRLEEEERLRREAAERERLRLLELARQARNQRMMERQLTKQKTMAQNDLKLQQMREERERLEREKQEMEGYNSKCLNDADKINKEFGSIADRMEKSRLRRQETISIKNNILQRQATIAEQKKELDAALEGVDFASALAKVKNISQDDIVFLQNLRSPPERIKLCMEAVIMTLSNSTKKMEWDDLKKEISNINFRRNILTFDPESITDKVFVKVKKEYINNPQWNLAKINKASIAAGAFAEWLDAVIKFKAIKMENKPLFDKIKALKKEEAAMQEDVDKLDDLDAQEKEFEKEQHALDNQTEEFKERQKHLQKQATLNLDDIKERQDKIKKLNTGEISLDEIAESDEESDIDSDIDAETLKNLNEIARN